MKEKVVETLEMKAIQVVEMKKEMEKKMKVENKVELSSDRRRN
jgi:hypothetical protein